MNGELMVRVYEVGCGDCILVRIPDTNRNHHILIDCGNFLGDSVKELRRALDNIKETVDDPALPAADRGHLDLVVATHRHWDHIKGYEEAVARLQGLTVDRIWLTKGMDDSDDHTHNLHELQAQATLTLGRLQESPGLKLSPRLHAIYLMGLSTQGAVDVLQSTLPAEHGIEPCYVYRGFENDLTPDGQHRYLLAFDDPNIQLRVLAPERDIDGSYVGHAFGQLERNRTGLEAFDALVPAEERTAAPANISTSQFRQLKSMLRYASLLAASESGHVINNTSVVLLLEWRNRRLLFTGDAELESWRLMWQNDRNALSAPLDFLKVAHHGSRNATPFNLDDANDSDNAILDSVLPRSNSANARAVVPTLAGRIRATVNPVPYPELMNELARRVSNTIQMDSIPGLQPQRTDAPEVVDWVDFLFD